MDTFSLEEMYKHNEGSVNLEYYVSLNEKKLVQIKKHPIFPLSLLNYTQKAQFKRKWSTELLLARGLVVVIGVIVARPLPKFFNDYELSHTPTGEFEVFEKLDGSLIIMSFYKGKPFFCARGSFTSEESLKAKEIYDEKYSNQIVDQNYTYCFEIIYPQNKIIIDYAEEKDLFLLYKIHTHSGKEVGILNTGFRCVKPLNHYKNLKELKGDDKANEEGYVVKFKENNFRIKIKFKSYVKLQKNSRLTRSQIVKLLQYGKEIPFNDIPDECFEELNKTVNDIKAKFIQNKRWLVEEFENIVRSSSKEGDIINTIKSKSNQKILFNIIEIKIMII